jgi:hypothetical protein
MARNFEWLMECHSDTPRAKLLEFAKGAPNFDELQAMSDGDLRASYCEMMAGAIEFQGKQSQASGMAKAQQAPDNVAPSPPHETSH